MPAKRMTKKYNFGFWKYFQCFFNDRMKVLGVPCLTLRDETEWVETVTAGWNRVVGTEPEQVLDAWFSFAPPAERPPIFGDGTAAQRIAQILDSDTITPGGLGGERPALDKMGVSL